MSKLPKDSNRAIGFIYLFVLNFFFSAKAFKKKIFQVCVSVRGSVHVCVCVCAYNIKQDKPWQAGYIDT